MCRCRNLSVHAIPALIKKYFDAIDAHSDTLEAWGTGSATREFFYVDDKAAAISLAADAYEKSEPVNIGSGIEISIKDLTELIVCVSGFPEKLPGTKPSPTVNPVACSIHSRHGKNSDLRRKRI